MGVDTLLKYAFWGVCLLVMGIFIASLVGVVASIYQSAAVWFAAVDTVPASPAVGWLGLINGALGVGSGSVSASTIRQLVSGIPAMFGVILSIMFFGWVVSKG